MRAALCGLLAVISLLTIGCHHNCRNGRHHHGCQTCGHSGAWAGGPSHVGHLPHGYEQSLSGPPGPPSATYAYPYYTTRAPRDFLLDNPPSIGP